MSLTITACVMLFVVYVPLILNWAIAEVLALPGFAIRRRFTGVSVCLM